jgi:CRP-like cAMP-binding protein
MNPLLASAFKASPLFSLAADVVANEQLRLIHVGSGEALFAEGDAGQSAYLVVSGVLGLYRRDAASQVDWLFRRAVLGSLIGELAIFADEPRSASAIALTDVVVAEISPAVLQRCIDQSPAFCQELLRTTATAASVGRKAIESELPQIILVELDCYPDSGHHQLPCHR